MKLGCFGKLGQIGQIERAGFECAELDICELVGLSDAEFEKFRERAGRSCLSYEVFSGLLPLSLRLYAPSFDEEFWLKHIKTGVRRASLMGARLIPFGAGKCRSIPEGQEERKGEYEKRLMDFIRKVCGIFEEYALTLAVEPLGRKNSNYLNTVEETADFVHRTGCSNCRIMCDLRHMISNGENFGVIGRYAGEIVHAHIDYPKGRRRLFPDPGDGFDYVPYLRALREAGYEGGLTIEATDYVEFEKEAAGGCRYIKELLKE